MRNKATIFFALLNTLVLSVGFICLAQFQKNARQAQARVKAAVQISAATNLPALPVPTSAPAPKTIIVYKTNQFQWNQLESTDYRQYIANLRSVGCPEATIRDLIMTDVMRLYALRRGQSYHNGRAFKYWETDEKRKLKHNQLEEQEKKLAQIDKELPAVLRELLGINYEREMNKYFLDTNDEEHRLSFLSESKRAQLAEVRDQWESKRDRLLDQAQNAPFSPADIEKLKMFQSERDEAISKILTADEREQFEMSTSPVANRLRSELVGFNPTEKEFRQMFALEQALDSKYAYQNRDDEAVRAAYAADQENMRQELKSELGENRMADLERSRNEDYRNLYTFVEQYDLPASTSQTLMEMRQDVESEKQKLMQDKKIPEDRRQKALKEMDSETERAFRQALGDKAFRAYSNGLGKWMHTGDAMSGDAAGAASAASRSYNP